MTTKIDPQTIDLDAFTRPFLVPPGKTISLQDDYETRYEVEGLNKSEGKALLKVGVEHLATQQAMLYAQNVYGILVIFQAIDAAGKDGAIKHVMSGVNPQGVHVSSFKAPSAEERDHDYMWRNFIRLPQRGMIGIFNRSYYEEVLVVRVHPKFLNGQQLPPELKTQPDIWQRRFREINNFEEYMVDNGFPVVKFFLNLSKEEQRLRFLDRIDEPDKNWKFSADDVHERQFWDDYQMAFEDMLNNTSTEKAPWYVIPADRKWFARLAVAGVLINTMSKLGLAYPEASEEQMAGLAEAKEELEAEAAD